MKFATPCRALERGDLELANLEHRRYRALGALGIRIGEQFPHSRSALPRQERRACPRANRIALRGASSRTLRCGRRRPPRPRCRTAGSGDESRLTAPQAQFPPARREVDGPTSCGSSIRLGLTSRGADRRRDDLPAGAQRVHLEPAPGLGGLVAAGAAPRGRRGTDHSAPVIHRRRQVGGQSTSTSGVPLATRKLARVETSLSGSSVVCGDRKLTSSASSAAPTTP